MDSAFFFLVALEAERFFFRNFFCFQNLDALYRPVAGKPFVLGDLCLGMGTSVACAATAETIFEIVKCISDVDMPARGRMGSKCEIFRFFNYGYAHDRNTGWRKKRPEHSQVLYSSVIDRFLKFLHCYIQR